MQQATQPTVASAPDDGNQSSPVPSDALFVINLTASTTPVALTSPAHPGLRHFTFFVSRRREDGRERFRLHMGYFQSQAEAEKLLDIVRGIYPGAWAGLAPGQRLRGAAKPLPTRAAPPSATPFAEPRPQVVAPLPAPPPAAPAPTAPRLQAVAPPAAPEPPKLPPAATPSVSVAPRELPVLQAAQQPLPVNIPVLSAVPDVAPAVSLPKPAAPPLAKATAAQPRPHIVPPSLIEALTSPTDETAAYSLKTVRAAIASLAEAEGKAPKAALATAPAAKPAKPPAVLQDREVLKVLESAIAAEPPVAEAPRAEPTLFAVQMMWSVQPINLAKVPQLAIFSAYTLYGAEGNRDGRRWYGLRLGFFTDAYSARQVALYVRPEFSAVSVVPVSARESERARHAVAKPLPAAKASPANISSSGEFKFLEPTPAKPRGAAPAASRPSVRTAGSTSGKRAKTRALPNRPVARPRAMSLEETLEILGANTLEIEQSNGQVLNDSGVRHLRAEIMKNPRGSKLGRLFERLGGALRD